MMRGVVRVGSGLLCRSLVPASERYGHGLLGVLLAVWHEYSDLAKKSTLHALTALVAAVPAGRRNSLAPILTSGVVQLANSLLALRT